MLVSFVHQTWVTFPHTPDGRKTWGVIHFKTHNRRVCWSRHHMSRSQWSKPRSLRKVCRASHSSVNLAQSALVRPSQECARHRTWTTPFGSVWHCLSRSIGKNVHISSRRIRKQSTRVTQAEHASCNSKQAHHPEYSKEFV